jgi:hypothetical protein
MCYMLQKSKIPRGICFRNLRSSWTGKKVVFPHLVVSSGILPEGNGKHRGYESTIICLGLNEYFVITPQKLKINSIPLIIERVV